MVLLLRLKDITATDSQRQILELVTELILRKKDLGEYLIDNDQELGGPLNLVRMTNIFANNFGIHDLSSFDNVFPDIGTYHKQNADSDVIEKLSQYYLVYHCINPIKKERSDQG